MHSTACVLVLASLTLCVVSAQYSEPVTSCHEPLYTPSGDRYYPYDLLKRPYENPYTTSAYANNGVEYTYRVNICDEVECDEKHKPGSAAGCQEWDDNLGDGHHERTTGQERTVVLSHFPTGNPDDGFVITYFEGDECPSYGVNRSTIIYVVCDKNMLEEEEPELLFEQEEECLYSFTLRSRRGACPVESKDAQGDDSKNKKSGGMKANTVIAVLLILGASGYLLGGTAYKKFYMGVDGMEAIPNYDTWRYVFSAGNRCGPCSDGAYGAHGTRAPEGFMVYNDDI